MIRKIILTITIVFSIVACKQKEETPKIDVELNELFALMQGSFNSEMQSKADSTYYNISLHMYPIWEESGNFLYVEQALNSMQDKPYRQRIYEVTRLDENTLKSAIYTIPADSLWIGKWETPEAFNTLTKSDLTLRTGCEVLLKRIAENQYKGKTGEKTCESTLRGASFATSEVEMTSDKIMSWDRGFDAEGNHIWGAEKGGYIFNKLD